MNKNDYIEKSRAILGDATKFKKLDKDPTRINENRLNQSLENFMDCRKHVRKTTHYDQ